MSNLSTITLATASSRSSVSPGPQSAQKSPLAQVSVGPRVTPYTPDELRALDKLASSSGLNKPDADRYMKLLRMDVNMSKVDEKPSLVQQEVRKLKMQLGSVSFELARSTAALKKLEEVAVLFPGVGMDKARGELRSRILDEKRTLESVREKIDSRLSQPGSFNYMNKPIDDVRKDLPGLNIRR